jgi:uncharacterized protein (TIGR00369 family)
MSRAETIFDRFPTPPIASHLGWTLIDQDAEKGWIKIAFEGRPEFVNPAGFVQGGILAAMLDDTMGPAVLIMSGGKSFTVTLGMSVSFLAPAKPGRLVGEGQVVQLGKTIAFVEGTLRDAEGNVVARASCQSRLIPTERLKVA